MIGNLQKGCQNSIVHYYLYISENSKEAAQAEYDLLFFSKK